MKKRSKSKKNFYQTMNDYIKALNTSKFFAGIVMLTVNLGSKYVTLQLSESQEDYIKYTLGRQILVFAILWMGTRDIVISLILTLIFILTLASVQFVLLCNRLGSNIYPLLSIVCTIQLSNSVNPLLVLKGNIKPL